MREDMMHVLANCNKSSRGIHDYRSRRRELQRELITYVHTGEDITTTQESMSRWVARHDFWGDRHGGYDIKTFRKWLLSQIGRDWDEVYSKISHQLRKLKNESPWAIWHNVETKTFIGDDGKVWYCDEYCSFGIRNAAEPIEGSLALVYVHPLTNRLVEVPPRVYPKRKEKGLWRVDIDKWSQGHPIKGDWYIVELAEFPDIQWRRWYEHEIDRYERHIESWKRGERSLYGRALVYYQNPKGRWEAGQFTDVAIDDIRESWFGEGPSYRYRYDRYAREAAYVYGRSGIYAKSRKQMNTNELKRYGLKR